MKNIQQILATPHMNYNHEKDALFTPLEVQRFSVTKRSKNLTIEMSKLDDNQARDVLRFSYKLTNMNCDKLLHVTLVVLCNCMLYEYLKYERLFN